MNDETTEISEEVTGPIGGERLRVARRENDISIGDIAKELHLDELKVRALERNEFDVLGAPVFAKGHLRKYAELVGVAVDDVMSDYYRMNRSAGAPPVVGPKRKHTRDISLGPLVGAGVAIIVVVAGATWWFNYEPAEPRSEIEPATLAPFSSSEEPAQTVNRELAESTVSSEDQPEADDVAAPIKESPPAVRADSAVITSQYPSTGGPQVEMNLIFSGDCWTEVSDASGRRLYYDLGEAGRVVTLSGDAPLHLILGDSANVSITVNGRDYPIPASARNGRLARLDIGSP
jgi:cytoskeleton protein RodZ